MTQSKQHIESKHICQSCAAKLEDDQGTEADGTQSQDYCSGCYAEGEFLEPEITIHEMIISNVASTAKSLDISLEEAKHYLESLLPTLKRWR